MGNENKPQSGKKGEDVKRSVQRMDAGMQRKLMRGKVYNMKIVIRGVRGVGKTSLLRRLQGMPFNEQYVPTPEISTAHVHWNYKNQDDAIKVEVWDVVDRAQVDKPFAAGRTPEDERVAGLPSDPRKSAWAKTIKQHGSHTIGHLDASIVDVYKGTQGVVFVYNITDAATFAYVKRELKKVPPHLPVLIIGNFRDKGAQRQVPQSDLNALVEAGGRDGVARVSAKRRLLGGNRYHGFEASFSQCFGMKEMYHYLNVPFLELKVLSLADQLAAAREELGIVRDEMSAYLEHHSYDKYLEWLKASKADPRTGTAAGAAAAPKLKIATPKPVAPTSPVMTPTRVRRGSSPRKKKQKAKKEKKKKDKKTKKGSSANAGGKVDDDGDFFAGGIDDSFFDDDDEDPMQRQIDRQRRHIASFARGSSSSSSDDSDDSDAYDVADEIAAIAGPPRRSPRAAAARQAARAPAPAPAPAPPPAPAATAAPRARPTMTVSSRAAAPAPAPVAPTAPASLFDDFEAGGLDNNFLGGSDDDDVDGAPAVALTSALGGLALDPNARPNAAFLDDSSSSSGSEDEDGGAAPVATGMAAVSSSPSPAFSDTAGAPAPSPIAAASGGGGSDQGDAGDEFVPGPVAAGFLDDSDDDASDGVAPSPTSAGATSPPHNAADAAGDDFVAGGVTPGFLDGSDDDDSAPVPPPAPVAAPAPAPNAAFLDSDSDEGGAAGSGNDNNDHNGVADDDDFVPGGGMAAGFLDDDDDDDDDGGVATHATVFGDGGVSPPLALAAPAAAAPPAVSSEVQAAIEAAKAQALSMWNEDGGDSSSGGEGGKKAKKSKKKKGDKKSKKSNKSDKKSKKSKKSKSDKKSKKSKDRQPAQHGSSSSDDDA